MHGFNLVEKSCMSSATIKHVLVQAQKVSVYFHKAPRAKDSLKKFAGNCGTSKMPQPACETRFSSLGTTVSVMLDLEMPMKMACMSPELNIPKDTQKIVEDGSFWISLKAINPILAAFKDVIMAIQRGDATLASVVRYFTYITHVLEAAKANIPAGNLSFMICIAIKHSF